MNILGTAIMKRFYPAAAWRTKRFWGGSKPGQDASNLFDKYTRTSFAVLDRAGHNLQIEQPGLFNALMHEWLDRVEENGIK
ncbi:alpha/beta fold hydrolase [Paenibacillus rhizophilus]|uniref:alpha/beta fold hydrolase n=1 Tax=Paenibacillus rhizophilus TaxID=1850366 RepID=UPI00163B5361|nr:alpha/beta hydrolase [Paenibacillus rhizophilus]